MTAIAETRACKNCYFVGHPVLPGSGWIEAVLWCCALAPGLIYSIWRRGKTRQNICPQCGAPNMLSLATPAGREIAEKYEGKTTEKHTYVSPPKKPSVIVEWFGWFMLFAMINMFVSTIVFEILHAESLAALTLPVALALTLLARYFYKKKTALKEH